MQTYSPEFTEQFYALLTAADEAWIGHLQRPDVHHAQGLLDLSHHELISLSAAWKVRWMRARIEEAKGAISADDDVVAAYNAAIKTPDGFAVGYRVYFNDQPFKPRRQGLLIGYDAVTEHAIVKDVDGEYRVPHRNISGVADAQMAPMPPEFDDKWVRYHEIIEKRDRISMGLG